MKLFSFLAVLSLMFSLTAQRVASDRIETYKGPLIIQPVFHGALVLTWNSKVIYIDPYGGAKAYEGLAIPDIIFITDIHADHMDFSTLESLNTSATTFIVPKAVAEKLPEKFKKNISVISNGESMTQDDIFISAVAMYNLPEEPQSRHVKGRGNGYILDMAGKRIYISGDTEDIPEMRKLKNIDVAFVCMNMPYTMDVDQASNAVIEFKPRIVYPYHYRGEAGLSDTEAFKKMVKEENSDIDVRLRNWYPVY